MFFMRKILLVIAISISASTLYGQSAYEGTIEFSKNKQDAYIIDYPYPPEAVENALIKKMESLGYKTKEEKGMFNKDKGFRIYKAAYITAITGTSMDYLFKVERKRRKEKDEAQLFMVVMKSDENQIRTFDAYTVSNAKGFLNGLLPDVEAADLEIKIKDQEDVVSKAEKKQKNLESDLNDMEKRLRKLQDDIEQNKKDQESQKKEIINQRDALDALRSRRKATL
jgi:hypothetical protein